MTYAASVPLSRISVHEQVRKDFNGIEELAASLKAQGQKQRILLRVQNEYASHPDGEENFNKLIEDLLKANDIKFDLVCGERRYRAAAFNKWESLNADIQILTDEEAREAQITENLLREDPHPLDESQAIKELVEAGRTFDQISAKLGKDVKFIKRRAGLLLLSKPLKRHFRNNVFGLQVAEILAGFPIAKQNAFAEDHIRKDGKEYYLNMTANDVWQRLSRSVVSLEKAQWDLADEKLYKAGGACIGCKFNTSSEGDNLLFQTEEGQCLKLSCWQKKSEAMVKQKLAEPDHGFVGIYTSHYWLGNELKEWFGAGSGEYSEKWKMKAWSEQDTFQTEPNDKGAMKVLNIDWTEPDEFLKTFYIREGSQYGSSNSNKLPVNKEEVSLFELQEVKNKRRDVRKIGEQAAWKEKSYCVLADEIAKENQPIALQLEWQIIFQYAYGRAEAEASKRVTKFVHWLKQGQPDDWIEPEYAVSPDKLWEVIIAQDDWFNALQRVLRVLALNVSAREWGWKDHKALLEVDKTLNKRHGTILKKGRKEIDEKYKRFEARDQAKIDAIHNNMKELEMEMLRAESLFSRCGLDTKMWNKAAVKKAFEEDERTMKRYLRWIGGKGKRGAAVDELVEAWTDQKDQFLNTWKDYQDRTKNMVIRHDELFPEDALILHTGDYSVKGKDYCYVYVGGCTTSEKLVLFTPKVEQILAIADDEKTLWATNKLHEYAITGLPDDFASKLGPKGAGEVGKYIRALGASIPKGMQLAEKLFLLEKCLMSFVWQHRELPMFSEIQVDKHLNEATEVAQGFRFEFPEKKPKKKSVAKAK